MATPLMEVPGGNGQLRYRDLQSNYLQTCLQKRHVQPGIVSPFNNYCNHLCAWGSMHLF